MIRSLRLINFKPFADQHLEFRALTLLSGMNNTGKSSVLQSLLLLRQAYLQGLLPNVGLALNGDLVRIGRSQDALFEGAGQDEPIGFDVNWDGGLQGVWRFQSACEADVLNLVSPAVDPLVYQSSLFSDRFHYLQAERMGPRTFFERSDVLDRGGLGTKGEGTLRYLLSHGRTEIPNQKLSHPRAKSLELIDQVEAWMGEISPGLRLDRVAEADVNLESLRYRDGSSASYRVANVGFGVTYSLPIVVNLLTSPSGSLVIVEHPEVHLHPQGQNRIGKLFGLAASCGVQVAIETHSDHVLNGIRLVVHDDRLDPNDVQLHYFQQSDRNGQIVTEVRSPTINSRGRLDYWPDGFFDQIDKDLEALMAPARG